MSVAQCDDALGKTALTQLQRRYVDRNTAKTQSRLLPDPRLPADLIQHPIADADDFSAFFGNGNEFGRAARTEPRTVPAQQGFDGRRLIADGMYQWLIDQTELV